MKKIKRILLLAVLAVMVNGQWSMVKGQCLNVRVGSVTYKFPAAQTGDMTYSGGQTLTIINKVFTIADISAIYIDDSEVVPSITMTSRPPTPALTISRPTTIPAAALPTPYARLTSQAPPPALISITPYLTAIPPPAPLAPISSPT